MSQLHHNVYYVLRQNGNIGVHYRNGFASLEITRYGANLADRTLQLLRNNNLAIAYRPRIFASINELGFIYDQLAGHAFSLPPCDFNIDLNYYEQNILPHIVSGRRRNFLDAINRSDAITAGAIQLLRQRGYNIP
ncbi:hypothetical protein [Xenorhabdus bovienii]|uniref:hypothetical protein n=1 Tax=Xenorhabdus bovienii TaxID=40576 RepID=UPI0012D2B391|nr:hypothetical protein [Xenorhabdus bovienii]